MGWSLPALGDLSRRVLRRFRLRAIDFLGRQKVTKDRLKDPRSLRISFPSNPAPCLPRDSALREPTRLKPACCRPWAVEGPAAPNGEAPCVGNRRSVGKRIRDVSEFAVDGGGKPPPYMLRFRRSVRNRSHPLPARRGRRALHDANSPGRAGYQDRPPPGGHLGPPLQIRGNALTQKIPDSSFLRRRKVRLPPFPPDGENSSRSLAPPFPNGPAAFAAGLRRGPLISYLHSSLSTLNS